MCQRTFNDPFTVKLGLMNVHEQIDRLVRLSPRIQAFIAIGVLLVVAGLAALCVYSGYRWAKSDAEIERTKQDDRIAVAEANFARSIESEKQMAAQNSILRKQNEAVSEALKTADTKREQEAAQQMAERNATMADRLKDIDADKDHDSIVCGLCFDARASGFPLSAEFCNRCGVKK